jgi:hypothetical protein
MANVFYNIAKDQCFDGGIVVLSDTIKALLVTSGYTANADHDFVDAGGANDVVDHEVSGTGYAAGYAGAGRKTLGSKTMTEDDTNDRGKFTAANLAWTAINGFTAAAVVLFKNGSSDDTTSKLICYIDGGFPVTANGGDVNVNWHADGIFYLS